MEHGTQGGRRSQVLRGSALLPGHDGGRTALTWLLAAGIPGASKCVALVAPCAKGSSSFEMRGIRMWEKTFRLPASAPITEDDLMAANEFRRALGEFQSWRKDIVNGEAVPCDPRGFAIIFKEAMQQKGSCRPASTMLDCFQDDVLGTVPQHIVCRFKCAYEDLFQIAAAWSSCFIAALLGCRQ